VQDADTFLRFLVLHKIDTDQTRSPNAFEEFSQGHCAAARVARALVNKWK
jgi:hypothetical protein